MGTMPVQKLLISMSLPMMISMLVQALYNIVDSMFVAWLSEKALTAVSLAFPIQMLMIGTGVGTGVGINALLSRSIGEKNIEEANRAALNGIFLIALSYVAFAIFGIVGTRAFFAAQTGDQEIIEYGTVYLTICLVCSFAAFFQMTMERILQSTGKTIYTMITQGTGAIVNIILDPIMIFGLLGFPKMGIAGAAVATVIGQFVAMVMAIIFNLKKNEYIKFSFRKFRPSGKTIKQIYLVGVPSIVMQSVSSIMTYGMNKIIMPYSATAVSVFGVYFKLNSFIFMPVFGLNNGMIPILAYNYGARHKERIMKTIRFAVTLAVSIMLIGMAIFLLIPDKLLMIFRASEEMTTIGVPALRIISLSFSFAGVCIVFMSVFQAFAEGFVSLIISVVRQLVVILPVAYLFVNLFGLNYIWWSFPIAEVFSVGLSTIFFIRLYRKKIHVL